MSQNDAQKESFQLILAGPRDNTPELLDQLQHAIAKELNLAAHAVGQLLESMPVTIAQSTDANKLEEIYDRLKSAGARLFILRTTRLNSKGSPTAAHKSEHIPLALDPSLRESQASDNIEYDSPNEQLSSLLGQLRKNALIDGWCTVEDITSDDSIPSNNQDSVSFWNVPDEWDNLDLTNNSPIKSIRSTAISKRDK